MLRQAENTVKIVGILSEIDLKPLTFKKDGRDTEAISGVVYVKVKQMISGEFKELIIPVHCFSSKYTNRGTVNPAYDSIKRVMEDYRSIAMVGEEAADAVLISSGNIRMNEFYARDGRFVSYPRIHASFINKIDKTNMRPEATWTAQFVVAKKIDEINAQGEETGRVRIEGILPQYGGKVDVVPFFAETPRVIDGISTWEIGDTVPAHGKLNFSSVTETVVEESGWGDPIEKVKTTSVSELVITGGNEPYDDERAYDNADIQDALAERKVRIEAQKDQSAKRAEAAAKAPKMGFDNLGF